MSKGFRSGLKANLRSLVTFFIGLCIGAGAFLFVYSQKIDGFFKERDAYYYDNNQKYKEIEKLQHEIEELSGHGRKSKTDFIKKIGVEVISKDSFKTETIQVEVENLLSPFLDKSTEWISNNPEIVESVLEKKQISIESDQKVEIRVKYISCYHSTLKIWVTAKEIANDPNK